MVVEVQQKCAGKYRNDKGEELKYLARVNNVTGIKKLLRNCQDPNYAGNNTWTALQEAAHAGNPETARALIESGADMEKPTSTEYTPLLRAISENKSKGFAQVAKYLVYCGANVEADEKGWTSLHKVAYMGEGEADLAMLELLLKYGADPNRKTPNNEWQPVHLLASYNRRPVATKMVELLVESGATLNQLVANNDSLLHLSCASGNKGLVEYFLRNGLDVNGRNTMGYTALHNAAENKHLAVVEVLLDNGADIDAKSFSGKTAVMLATEQGSTDIVKILLRRKPDLSVRNKQGEDVLAVASRKGLEDIVGLLRAALERA